MSLSITIPTCKRAKYLSQNLASIIASKVSALEIIIGDDGGDEETRRICEIFSKDLPIKYLKPAGKGSLATNITRLIREAKGEWILLLHDDDFLVGDHSMYPAFFSDKCDFFFTDHYVATENGEIDEIKSIRNSEYYARNILKEGLQSDPFNLTFEHRVCLDGFYIKKTVIKEFPNNIFGNVADYFWIFNILNSKINIWYSSKRTFAYRLSSVGLTSQGLNFYSVKGYRHLLKNCSDAQLKKKYKSKISLNTWHAVNTCIRQRDKKNGWKLLVEINFHYYNSLKHNILMPLQILLLIFSK